MKCPTCRFPNEQFYLKCPNCGDWLGKGFDIGPEYRPIVAELPYPVLVPIISKWQGHRRRLSYDGKTYILRIRAWHGVFTQNRCVECGLKITKWLLLQSSDKGPLRISPVNDDYIVFTVDHIVPRSKNGGHEFSNLQTMCHGCNHRKGNHG
mgnify:CR=1 FL=1